MKKRSNRKKKSWICEHNKQKYKCVLCDGSHMCKHKKQKASCKNCREEMESKYWELLMEKFKRTQAVPNLGILPGINM